MNFKCISKLRKALNLIFSPVSSQFSHFQLVNWTVNLIATAIIAYSTTPPTIDEHFIQFVCAALFSCCAILLPVWLEGNGLQIFTVVGECIAYSFSCCYAWFLCVCVCVCAELARIQGVNVVICFVIRLQFTSSIHVSLNSRFLLSISMCSSGEHTQRSKSLECLASYVVYCFVGRCSLSFCWLLIKFSLFLALPRKMHRQPWWQDNRFLFKTS